MIIGFVGDGKTFMGIGKTLCMTAFAFSDYEEGATVYSNYKLMFKHKQLVIEDFLKESDIKKATVCIDELHIFADSSARTKLSRLLTYFTLQTQKRDVNFYWTSQRFFNVDLRIRNVTDLVFICNKYHYDPDSCKWLKCFGDMECKLEHQIRITEKNTGYQTVIPVDKYKAFYDRKELIHPLNGEDFV